MDYQHLIDKSQSERLTPYWAGLSPNEIKEIYEKIVKPSNNNE